MKIQGIFEAAYLVYRTDNWPQIKYNNKKQQYNFYFEDTITNKEVFKELEDLQIIELRDYISCYLQLKQTIQRIESER